MKPIPLGAMILSIWPLSLAAMPYSDGVDKQEVTALVSAAMQQAGKGGAPMMGNLRKFPACDHQPTIRAKDDDWRTVELSCSAPTQWRRAVRTNARLSAPVPRAVANDAHGPMVVTLAQSLARGTVIEPQHLTLKPAGDVILDGQLFAPENAIGRTLTVNLGHGRALQARHLEHSWLVTKGSPVAIAYETGGMIILATGIAAENGQRGQLIAVENTGSARIIKAIVAERNKVRVGAKMN